MRAKLGLTILCLLAAIGVARAQVWNLAQYAASSSSAHEAVFDNSGNPWPAFNQINAFNYDLGGQGIAYGATQGLCTASGAAAYRAAGGGGSGDVINPKVSADSGTQFLIGCTAVNNFFRYTVAFSQAGPYVASMRLASGAANSATWTVSIDGVAATTVNSPPTGGYTAFATQTSSSFNTTFPANHIVTVTCSTVNSDTGCGDFNWLQFSQAGSVTAPAPAVAAGFSTLVFESDFSQPFYVTKSNWLDCAQAASPQWWLGWRGSTLGDPSCNNISIVSDGGTQVLRTTWNANSHVQNGPFGVFLETMENVVNSPVGKFFSFAYIEVIGRGDRTSPSHLNDFWSVAFDGGGIEFDGVEWMNGGSDSCIHNNHQNPPGSGVFCVWTNTPPASPSTDFSQYHKFAWRITSDGTSSVMCAYIDDVFQPGPNAAAGHCETYRASNNQLAGNGDGFPLGIQIFNSAFCADSNDPCDSGTGTFNVYVKSVRAWSCPNALTPGGVCLSSTPNP